MTEKQFECVILADGDHPSHPMCLEILRQAEFVCCCDGAAVEMINRGHTPNAIVGDGDSLSDVLKARYADIIHIVDEQDYNDLTKCTRFCLERGYRRIAYLGCTGKREDHTLGNISLMSYYMKELGIAPTMITDYGYFRPYEGDKEIQSFHGQQISIFNLNCTKIVSEGLKWDTFAFNQWWQGTLNEAISESFRIFADGSYIIYQTHDPK